MLSHKIDLNSSQQNFMNRLCRALAVLIAVGAMTCFTRVAAAQDGTFSLGGNAEIVNNNPALGHPKAFQLPSTCTKDCLRGGTAGELTTSSVIYLPDHSLRFRDLHTLSADYRRIDGDCGGGSMRWEIGLDTNGDGELDGRVFVYFGQLYNFTRCSQTWVNTGSFIGPFFEDRWDLSQFRGRFYSTHRDAANLLGEALVCYVILVVDGAWYPDRNPPTGTVGRQTFQVDRVRVNNDVFNANQAAALAQIEASSIARLNLGRYLNPVSDPINIFSQESYLGRRYSLRSLLQMMGGGRTTSGREESRSLRQ